MENKNKIDPEWESVRELEERTGRSRWSWRRDAYEGRIGSSKVGTRLFIRRVDADRMMEAGYRPALGEQAA